MIGTSYFAWLGTLYLIILTIKDFKNNMKIDDRANFFMLGIAISLYSHFNYRWYFGLSVIGILLLLRYLLGKFKILGDADISSLNWIFIGLAILNLGYLVFFLLIVVILWGFYYSLGRRLTKNPLPFYPVLLLSFWISCFFLSIY